MVTDAAMVSKSSGLMVRRSMISTEMPSPSSIFAAASARWVDPLLLTMVRVAAFAADAGLADISEVFALRHLVLVAVELLVLDEADRVVASNGALEQALRIVGGRQA